MLAASEQRCSRCGEPVGSSLGGSVCAACLFEGVLIEEDSNGDPFAQPSGEFPKWFGPYELLEEVGRGGMGVIYRARQPGLDRAIALKMLLAGEFADENARKRLLREARAVARLSHPNIVSIHEVGEHEGRPYFAMEHISGQNLARIVHSGPLSIARIAELISKLAQAVHYAHTQGVIHRDLKPANVLVDERGDPKLTDFGLTKTAVDLTQTIASAGSPNFMAPEQASRERGPTGVHTDVFGLGAILYFLLTGRPPFSGGMLGETIRAVLEEDPVPPRQVRRDTPPDLETICLKCLRKAHLERYATALELAQDLERFLRLEPIRARRIGALGRFARWSRRNPALAALLATAFLALILITLQWRRARAGEFSALQNAYAAQMLLAQQRYESLNAGGAIDLLNELRPKSGGLDFRGFEWAYLYDLCHQEKRVVPVENTDVNFMAFTRSGKYLLASVASFKVPSQLHLFDSATGEKLRVFGSNEMRFAIAPDERLVASVRGTNAIFLRDFPSGEERSILLGHSNWVYSLAFSPDGRTLASGAGDKTVRLWNVADGKTLRVMPANTNLGVLCVAWDRTGTRVFAGGDDGLAYIFDPSDGRQINVLRGHAGFIYTLAISPDGETLATGGDDKRILLWNISSGQQIGELRGHASTVYGLAFSPDGRQLASGSWDSTVRLWNVPKKIEERVMRTPSFTYCVTYSPDGKNLASGGHDGTIRFWDPNGDHNPKVLEGPRNTFASIEFSKDANWLLRRDLRTENIGSTLWDLRGFRTVGSWESPLVQFLPDGQRILIPCRESLAIYDPRAVGEPEPLPVTAQELAWITFSADGKRIATVSTTGEGKLWAWLGEPAIAAFPVLAGSRRSAVDIPMQFSPNSQWLVHSTIDFKLQVRDAKTGRLWHSITCRSHFDPVSISPDSKLVAFQELDGSHGLYELETGRRRMAVPNKNLDCRARFSPNSKNILIATSQAMLELFDANTGRRRFALKGHHGSVLFATFSPDGRRIATAGDDHTIKIWDAESGRELISLQGHETEAYHITFSSDGRHLASWGRDGALRIWTAANEGEVAAWELRDRSLAASDKSGIHR